MTIERTALPGVGVAHVTTTRGGQRVGIISRFTGERDIVLYDPDDVDTVICTVTLQPDEAHRLADLLGSDVTVDHVRVLEQQLGGITAVRVRLPVGSPFDGRSLAQVQARLAGGASIVAVDHGGRLVVGPGPDVVLREDDTVVVVGEHEAVTALAGLLTGED